MKAATLMPVDEALTVSVEPTSTLPAANSEKVNVPSPTFTPPLVTVALNRERVDGAGVAENDQRTHRLTDLHAARGQDGEGHRTLVDPEAAAVDHGVESDRLRARADPAETEVATVVVVFVARSISRCEESEHGR